MLQNGLWFSEKNIHGAWVCYGDLGIRQYYYCTKKEAEKKYRDELRKVVVENER